MFLKMFFKEMKDSFRDRRTLLLTVVLPLIMMTALVFYYESLLSDDEQTYNLAVEKGTSEEILSIFSTENFNFVETDDPEFAVEEGEAHTGILFDDQFTEKVETHQQATVKVISGDSFSQNASNANAQVMAALQQYEQAIVNERLTNENIDQQLMTPFQIEQEEITDDNAGMALLGTLIPLILVLAIGIGATPSASDLFAGEKEKKTMEALLMTPVKRSTMIMAKWLTISAIGSITGIVTLIVVALEIQFMTENLKDAVASTENIGLIIGIVAGITIIYATFLASILMVTSIMAKTIKESQSYSTPVMMLGMFPIMILTSVGTSELEFHHFAIPILNIFSSLKELLVGVIDWEHIFITVGSNLIAMIIIFIIGRIMFLKDKWVMN